MDADPVYMLVSINTIYVDTFVFLVSRLHRPSRVDCGTHLFQAFKC